MAVEGARHCRALSGPARLGARDRRLRNESTEAIERAAPPLVMGLGYVKGVPVTTAARHHHALRRAGRAVRPREHERVRPSNHTKLSCPSCNTSTRRCRRLTTFDSSSTTTPRAGTLSCTSFAGQASALPHARHAELTLVAESTRALFRSNTHRAIRCDSFRTVPELISVARPCSRCAAGPPARSSRRRPPTPSYRTSTASQW